MIGCCWPPEPAGGAGSLQIGFTPVAGGTPGEILKVGAGGLLDQSVIPVAPVTIGGPVTGGTPNTALFIDAAGHLAQDPPFFGYTKTTHTLSRAGDLVTLDLIPTNGHHFYIAQSSFVIAGSPDAVVSLGFNSALGITPYDPTKGIVLMQFESNGAGGGLITPEWHLVFGSRDQTKQIRAFTFSANETAPNQCDVLGTIAGNQVLTTKQDGTICCSNLCVEVLHWDQGFTCDTYSSNALSQRNSINTADLQLMSLRLGVLAIPDTLSIAGGALQAVEILQQTLIFSRQAETVPVLQLASTARLDVYVVGIDPNGVISADAGCLALRHNGVLSTIYVNRSAVNPGTTWVALV